MYTIEILSAAQLAVISKFANARETVELLDFLAAVNKPLYNVPTYYPMEELDEYLGVIKVSDLFKKIDSTFKVQHDIFFIRRDRLHSAETLIEFYEMFNREIVATFLDYVLHTEMSRDNLAKLLEVVAANFSESTSEEFYHLLGSLKSEQEDTSWVEEEAE